MNRLAERTCFSQAWTRPLREFGGMVVDLSKELLRRDSGESGGGANWVFESCDPRESPAGRNR